MSVYTWGQTSLASIGTQLQRVGSWLAGKREPTYREKLRSAWGGIANKIQFLPYTDSVVGETAIMRQNYRKMLSDPTVKAAILSKLFSVASLDPTVNPASESESDRRAAEFVTHAIARTRGGMRGIAETILLPGMIEGYSLTEKVFALEDRSGPWQGKILTRMLKSKDPDTYTLEGDEYKNVQCVKGRMHNHNEEWSIKDFIHYRNLPIYDNATGQSDLRAAYRAYWTIDTAWKMRVIHLEKWMTPYLVGKFKDRSDEPSLRDSLEQAKGSHFITVPDTVMIEAMNLSVMGTADFQSAILDLQHEVMLGITGAFLQAMEGVKTGARSIGEVHQSTAELLIWHMAECLADCLNEQWVPDLIDFNFPPGTGYPIIALGGVNDADLLLSTQVDEALQRMGLELSRKDAYARYRRTKPLDADDVLMPAMPAPAPAFSEEPEPPAPKYIDEAVNQLFAGRLAGYNGVTPNGHAA